MDLCAEAVNKRPHAEDEEDEVIIVSACAIAIKKRRLDQQLAKSTAEACRLLMDAYVKYRGGLNAIATFVLPADGTSFDFDNYCDKLFIQDFRFSKSQVNCIVDTLIRIANFPREVVSDSQDRAPLRVAFLMLCMKYAWPTRLGAMIKLFGKSIAWSSRVIKKMRVLLFNFCHSKMRCPEVLSAVDVQRFSAAIERISGLDVCFGFLDATVRPICRPSIGQKECYNGKDRLHAIKFQICSTPDGIIQHIDGPWPGRRHDNHMVNSAPLSSGTPALASWILSHPRTRYGTAHVVYADQGYYTQPGIETPWPDGAFNLEHQVFNDMMKSSRIAVEWEFGHILEHWASLHFKPSQKMLTGGLGQQYIVAAFLTNIYNCLHPSKTSLYFKVTPPDLCSYLSQLQ
jgi:hypothetical protein